jgi:hypothetical protein
MKKDLETIGNPEEEVPAPKVNNSKNIMRLEKTGDTYLVFVSEKDGIDFKRVHRMMNSKYLVTSLCQVQENSLDDKIEECKYCQMSYDYQKRGRIAHSKGSNEADGLNKIGFNARVQGIYSIFAVKATPIDFQDKEGKRKKKFVFTTMDDQDVEKKNDVQILEMSMPQYQRIKEIINKKEINIGNDIKDCKFIEKASDIFKYIFVFRKAKEKGKMTQIFPLPIPVTEKFIIPDNLNLEKYLPIEKEKEIEYNIQLYLGNIEEKDEIDESVNEFALKEEEDIPF